MLPLYSSTFSPEEDNGYVAIDGLFLHWAHPEIPHTIVLLPGFHETFAEKDFYLPGR